MLTRILKSGKIKSSEAQKDLYPGSNFQPFLSTSAELFRMVNQNDLRPVGVVLDKKWLMKKYDTVRNQEGSDEYSWVLDQINMYGDGSDEERVDQNSTHKRNALSLKEIGYYSNPKHEFYLIKFANWNTAVLPATDHNKKLVNTLWTIADIYNAEPVKDKGVATMGKLSNADPRATGTRRIDLDAKRNVFSQAVVARLEKLMPDLEYGEEFDYIGYEWRSQLGGFALLRRDLMRYADAIAAKPDCLSLEDLFKSILDWPETQEHEIRFVIATLADGRKADKKDKSWQDKTPYIDVTQCLRYILLPESVRSDMETDFKANKAKLSKRELLSYKRLRRVIEARNLFDSIYYYTEKSTNDEFDKEEEAGRLRAIRELKADDPSPSAEDIKEVADSGLLNVAAFNKEGGFFGFMSNFYPSPIKVTFTLVGGGTIVREFFCGEQLFHYYKAVHFKDRDAAKKLRGAKTAAKCLDIGKHVKNFDEDEWSRVSVGVMRKVLRHKFEQNPDLAAKLKATGDLELAETVGKTGEKF